MRAGARRQSGAATPWDPGALSGCARVGTFRVHACPAHAGAEICPHLSGSDPSRSDHRQPVCRHLLGSRHPQQTQHGCAAAAWQHQMGLQVGPQTCSLASHASAVMGRRGGQLRMCRAPCPALRTGMAREREQGHGNALTGGNRRPVAGLRACRRITWVKSMDEFGDRVKPMILSNSIE